MSELIKDLWEVTGRNPVRVSVVESKTGLIICQMRQPRAIAEPNARLIAQAPTYTEWAKKWLRQYESGYSMLMLAEAIEKLKAIHAKATGGQP